VDAGVVLNEFTASVSQWSACAEKTYAALVFVAEIASVCGALSATSVTVEASVPIPGVGTTKSVAVTAVPAGVVTWIRPVATFDGTGNTICVLVSVVGVTAVELNKTVV